jgi:hypothetical protein
MPFYPAQCRGFPWTDADGDRYEYDVTICGEFQRRPELIAIQRRGPSSNGRSTAAQGSSGSEARAPSQ